ncbi:MAG: hypothetical protein GY841_18140, partial [FCB group bacterium]|nr:hypothetical protein [FCB group bacterium]
VVRQYLLGEQREALSDLHRGLLERCRPAGGRWPELALEDDYLWRHLANHLVAAGHGETLRERWSSRERASEGWDMEANDGDLLGMFRWVGENEEDLRERFLARFGDEVEDDTRERFLEETSSDRLRNHVYQVAKEFDRTRRDFENARKRLRHRRKELSKAEPADKVAEAARDEVEIELR